MTYEIFYGLKFILIVGKETTTSKVFESVEYFLDNLALGDIETAAGLFPCTSDNFFSPREIDEYNR